MRESEVQIGNSYLLGVLPMKLSLAVLAVVLLTFARPARADTFQMSGGGVLYSGFNGSTPISAVETFDTSFIYDSVSVAVSAMSFTSQGLLGNFAFTGVIDNGVATHFQWSNADGILTGTFLDQDFAFASSSHVPTFSGGTKPILLTCLTAACTNDFVNGFTFEDSETHFSADFLGPSPVPEPPSLALLAAGLLGSVLFMRRKLTFSR